MYLFFFFSEDISFDEHEASDGELAAEEEAIAADSEVPPDDGHDAYDAAEIGTLREQAIQMMEEEFGVTMDSAEAAIALGIFPCVGPIFTLAKLLISFFITFRLLDLLVMFTITQL